MFTGLTVQYMDADLYVVGFLTEEMQKLAYLLIKVALARRRILQSGRFRHRHGEKSLNLNKTFGLNLAFLKFYRKLETQLRIWEPRFLGSPL